MTRILSAGLAVLSLALGLGAHAALAQDCKQSQELMQQAGSQAKNAAALKLLNKAHKLCPSDWRIAMRLGQAYAKQGEYQKAKANLMTARKARPDALLPLAYLGEVHYSQGNYAKAAEAYTGLVKALKNGPGFLQDGNTVHKAAYFEQKLADCHKRIEAHEKSMRQIVGSEQIVALLAGSGLSSPGSGTQYYGQRNSLNLALLFDSNSAKLSQRSREQLIELAKAFNSPRLANAPVEIIGHTDNFGKASYNLKLSQKRAAAVREFLVGQGVDPARLTSSGQGEAVLLVSEGDQKAQAVNRRVEFNVPVMEQAVPALEAVPAAAPPLAGDIPGLQAEAAQPVQPEQTQVPPPAGGTQPGQSPEKTDDSTSYFK